MKRLFILQFPNVTARAGNMRGSFRLFFFIGLSVPSGPLVTIPVRQATMSPLLGEGSLEGPLFWTSFLQISATQIPRIISKMAFLVGHRASVS